MRSGDEAHSWTPGDLGVFGQPIDLIVDPNLIVRIVQTSAWVRCLLALCLFCALPCPPHSHCPLALPVTSAPHLERRPPAEPC